MAEEPPAASETFRIGGLVEEGTLVRGDGETVRFSVTDGGASIPVTFTGVLPDLFKENEGFRQTRGLMQFTARLLKSVEQRKTDDVFLIGTQHLDLNDEQVKDEIERISPKLVPAVTRDIADKGSAISETLDDEIDSDAAQQVMTLLLVSSLSRAVGGRIGLSESEIIEFLAAPNRKADEFLDVIQKLREQAWYLHREDQRYFIKETENLFELTKRISEDSYQIDVTEASMIAAMLLGERYLLPEESYSLLNLDPILREPVSVRVFTMQNTNWKLVVSMPIKYTDKAVSEITDSMLELLFILLILSATFYGVFFKTAFLSPVNRMTSQIRKLVSREDYITKLNIYGADELSQLASWFNIRTAQLSDVLDKLKIKNNALDEARLESDQANRTKNIFLASMSHDIRTPMNAIVGMSELLGKSELGPEQSNYARVINSSAQALLLLINDIMDFSKIEANQLNLEKIAFNLREIVDDCADLISFQALEKNLEFIYFLSPEINPNLIGDPSRIRQIILNLAGNALKFTKSGRVELWIETTHQTDDVVNLHVDIRDTGIGLSESAKENLFIPFLQGDDSITRKFGGTGLGLTISKHLADLMGGSIQYRSVENIGTTFTFSVKLNTQDKLQEACPEHIGSHENNMLFVLGQNHFQNAVVERYAEAVHYECKICSTLQGWLSVLENGESNSSMSLCGDLGLLGDLTRLTKLLPPNLDQHRIIVLKSQNDDSWNDLKVMVPELNILPITLPLKFDAFNKLLNLDIYVEPATSSENVLLSTFNYKKILVVEDNKVNQQVIVIMLRHLGLNADVVNDGIEAVEALQIKNYDLILMDWQMPRMDGLEATRRIRALSFETKPVIIAVTANAMSGDIDKCLEAGMDDYLSKPIRREKLALTLEKWLV